MSGDLDKTRKIRAGHRAAATRVGNEIVDLVAADVTKESIARLKTIKKHLEAKLTVLKGLDEKILEIIEPEEIEQEIEVSSEVELKISENLVICQDFLDEQVEILSLFSSRSRSSRENVENATAENLESNNQETRSVDSRASSPLSIAENGYTDTPKRNSSAKAKLPKVGLPKFNGDITKFLSFWDMFESMVDSNENLTSVDKFNYLKGALEGTAAKAIEGLPVRDKTYHTAVEILKERFGNVQKIISSHMDQMIKIKPCESENVQQLRSIYDQINVQVRGLEALGVTADKYGSLLIPIIMAILPDQISLQIARHTSNAIWTLTGLMEILKREVEARELYTQVSITEKGKTKNIGGQTLKKIDSTSSALNVKNEESSRLPSCVFCQKRHYSAECRTVSDVNERKNLLQKSGRCFVCLNKGHIARKCSTNRRCRNCNRSHHPSICRGETTKETKKQESVETETIATTSRTQKNGGILLQTARTFAYSANEDRKIPVRILLDSGSQRSYVNDDVKRRLNLEEQGKEVLNLNTFGNSRYRKQTCSRVTIKVETLDGNFVEIQALSYPVICSPVRTLVDVDSYPHLMGLRLADCPEQVDTGSDDIDILVGIDYYHEIVTGEAIRGSYGPTAVSSKLGWLISGPSLSGFDPCIDTYVVSNVVLEGTNDSENTLLDSEELVASLKQIFDAEPPEAVDVRLEKEEFKGLCNIHLNGNRFETGLPWKRYIDEPLHNNKSLCLSRLKSLYSRLKKDRELLYSYDSIFQDQLTAGIIERVPKEMEDKANVHMMPHHGVIRKNRLTSKLRVVFDGSAKAGPHCLSLNDHLEIGPNFVPQIFDLLTDFRSNRIALTADIEKAFLQIDIRECERDYLRFFWFDDVTINEPVIIQYRYCRLPFGLTSSPAILGATLHDLFSTYQVKYPESMKILSRFYVDDLTTGCHDVQSGLNTYRTAKEITSSASLNLCKWHTNSKELLQKINVLENESNIKVKSHSIAESNQQTDKCSSPIDISPSAGEDTQSYAKTMTGLPNNDVNTKVLGLNWNTDNDNLFFDVTEVGHYANTLPATKRSLLKLTAKIYDPLGALSPFVIRLKSLFQQTCIEKLGWDEELQGEFRLRYFSLLSELQDLEQVSLPRCYFADKNIISIQLHGFSDASEHAFASVIYIRTEYEDGQIDVRFVSSKANVSPIKAQSVPRLELMGAVLLAKHMHSVKNALSVDSFDGTVEVYFWVDSSTVLCWIRNNKPWKQFVRHRIQQITTLSSRKQWKFCPGNLNPADIPSRGIRGSTLSHHEVWWYGPKFLSLPPSEWPEEVFTGEGKYHDALTEIVQSPPILTFALSNTEHQEGKLSDLLDINKFSSKAKLLRVVGWVYRFVANVRLPRKQGDTALDASEIKNATLDASEIQNAEAFIIRKIQSEQFRDELSFLRQKTSSNSRKPPLLVNQFNLYVDDVGVIRTRSRIKNANIEFGPKEPILLPSRHYYSDLVIQEYHSIVFHNGVRDTLNAIRQKYWILRGRESVKKLVRKCVICRKLEGVFFKPVVGHDLPPSRVDDGPAFINSGLDFMGPLFVFDRNSSGQSRKVYVCLFTCMSTRAVHLELVDRLDVQSFLRCFRRFSARRGLPRTLLSDNAKTYKSASKEVKNIILSTEVQTYLADRSISWQFIVQKAAWNAGAWERLIRSVKRCLRKVIGRASLNYEELSTLLIEVEGVINSRPITYVYDDTEGISYPLTPADLVYGYSTLRTPSGRCFEILSTNEALTRRANYHKRLLQHFSNRWKSEYLLGIRESLSSSATSEKPSIEVGDVVIVKNDQSKRQFWKLARVEELITGRDGNIRAAKIRVPNEKGTSLLTRHLKHLAPLEVTSNVKAVESVVKPNVLRPRRTAAIVGELRRKDNV